MSPQQGISLREFGRQLGVSGEYVRRAVADGKIPASCVGEITLRSGSKRPVITDPDAAAKHWGRSRDVTQVRDKAAMSEGARKGWEQRRGKTATAKEKPPAPLTTTQRSLDDDDEVDDGTGLPSIAQSKRRTEFYRSEDARLDHEERAGRLVDAELIKVKFVGMITTAKTKLLAVPTKAKGRIPTLTFRDIEILEDLINEALVEVADGR